MIAVSKKKEQKKKEKLDEKGIFPHFPFHLERRFHEKKKIESKINSPSFELSLSRLNRLNVLNCSFSMKGAKIPINIVSKLQEDWYPLICIDAVSAYKMSWILQNTKENPVWTKVFIHTSSFKFSSSSLRKSHFLKSSPCLLKRSLNWR